MILRTYFVLLLACWLSGYSADGMYLKYKLSPNISSLTIETVPRNGIARSRDSGHWMHRNRKKLVALDRKNKFVAAFIQKLIKLIEKEKNGEKPKSISKLSNTQKIPCIRSFGHLFNSRFRKCGPTIHVTTKPILKLMTVNVIPLKSENVFVDSTRQGSDDEFDFLTSSDTDSLSDTSDYTDDDFESRARVVHNFRRQGHPLYRATPNWSDDDSSNGEDVVQSGKKLKRFEVVTNGKVTAKEPHDENNFTSLSDSDEERVQSKNDTEQEDVQPEETDSDEEKVLLAPKYSEKTVKAHDTEEDSDSETTDVDEWEPKKQKIKPKVIKKPKYSGELTSLEVSKEKKSKKKKQSNNYVYLQGPQAVNSDMETDDDARRDGMNRLQNFFMPKRNIWDSSEIQHLSYYWFNGPQGLVLYS